MDKGMDGGREEGRVRGRERGRAAPASESERVCVCVRERGRNGWRDVGKEGPCQRERETFQSNGFERAWCASSARTVEYDPSIKSQLASHN